MWPKPSRAATVMASGVPAPVGSAGDDVTSSRSAVIAKAGLWPLALLLIAPLLAVRR